MIVSVQLADVGFAGAGRVLLRRPRKVAGLRYAVAMIAAPLRSGRLAAPQPGRVALIAGWDDDAAFDRFLAHDRLAARLAHGWQARFEPVRTAGAWPLLPGLPAGEPGVSSSDGPVGVLTLARVRLHRLRPFLAASAPAERQAVSHPALLAGTALARPPRIVATFSLWRTVPEMREFAFGTATAGGHREAVAAHRARSFHSESAFIRLRPYAASGQWDGRNPL